MAIAEVIKFEGPKDALVWKNPGKEYLVSGNEKFNALSQLIVDEFYEAIFFANGRALDLFPSGRYTLSNQNLPLLSNVYKDLLDGEPFPCKVYYINKVNQLELKWGTSGGITLNDPIYNIFLHVGCCGTMTIRVTESRKFLLKFVGNKDVFTNDDLITNMRGIISANVKNYISKIMIQGKVSFFDMNAHIYEVGQLVARVLSELFADYGIGLEQFNIESIDVPEKDYEVVNKAKSMATSRSIQGFTWKEEQMYQILSNAAKNEGNAGAMMGAGMGMGMGMGIGVPMGNAFSDVAGQAFTNNPSNNGGGNTPNSSPAFNSSNGKENADMNQFFSHEQNANTTAQTDTFCPNCGAKLAPGAKFCSKCGTKVDSNTCPNCGNEVEPDAMFCSKCGTKLK
ncbi:MAG: SPFH domain-containing protein [Bacilli bacterium]|nr:SPFH domain-containing protein [Bacilli bacterium]